MDFKLVKPHVKQLPLIIVSAVATVAIATLVVTQLTQIKPTTALVAKRDLAEGLELKASDLETVRITLPSETTNYLKTLKPGLTLSRSIRKGELVPKTLLVDSFDFKVPIRLNNLPQISKEITVGDLVDLWASPSAQNSLGEPEPVCLGAIVTAIENQSSMSQTTTAVELRISTDYLESTLAAIDSNYKISLILHETLSSKE